MKITNKQKQEIKFFEDWGVQGKTFISTPEEQEAYINERTRERKERGVEGKHLS